MDIENAIIAKENIKQRNDENKRFCEDLQNNLQAFREDSEKKLRLDSHECKTCYYLRKKSIQFSQGMNIKICPLCKSAFLSEEIDEYVCAICTEKYDVCYRCGGTVEE